MRNKAKQFGLGKPELDPQNITPTGKGFYERYSGGNVYYNPTTKGIYVVYGAILSKWGELGWENGALGFPTSDEKDSDKAGWKRMSTFDKGIIYWNDGKLEVVKKKFRLDNSRNPIFDAPYDPSKPIITDHLVKAKEMEVYVSIVPNVFTEAEIKNLATGNDPKIKVYYNVGWNIQLLTTDGVVYKNIDNHYWTLKYKLSLTELEKPTAIILTLDENILTTKKLTLNGDALTIGTVDEFCQQALEKGNLFNLPYPGFVKIFDENRKGCRYFRNSDANKVYRFHIENTIQER
jgi:hypothetical protein